MGNKDELLKEVFWFPTSGHITKNSFSNVSYGSNILLRFISTAHSLSQLVVETFTSCLHPMLHTSECSVLNWVQQINHVLEGRKFHLTNAAYRKTTLFPIPSSIKMKIFYFNKQPYSGRSIIIDSWIPEPTAVETRSGLSDHIMFTSPKTKCFTYVCNCYTTFMDWYMHFLVQIHAFWWC